MTCLKCPESFGCEEKLVNLSDELPLEVAELAEIDQAPNDFLSVCKQTIICGKLQRT